jgi:hypothetical protein
MHPAAQSPRIYSTSNRIEYQRQIEMLLERRTRKAHEADNLTAICELIVWTLRDPQHLTIL